MTNRTFFPHTQTEPDARSQTVGWVALACILGGFAAWGMAHLGGFSWSWDEGVMLMTSRAVSQGHALYDPTWYNYPPLLPLLLGALFRWFGPSEELARGVTLGFALLLAGGVAHITWQITHRSLAAAGTALLLVLTPPFLVNSRAVLADVPALCLAVWSLSLALRAREHPRWGLWIGSGVLLGLSLAIKPTSAFVGLPLAYAALRLERGPGGVRLALKPLAGLAIGAALVLGLSVALVEPAAFWRQFAGSLVTSKEVHTWHPLANLAKIGTYLALGAYGPARVEFPLMLAVGVLSLLRREARHAGALLLLWLSAGAVMWFVYTPLYNHQIITLLAPAAVLAGLGVDWIVAFLSRRVRLAPVIQVALVIALALFAGGGAVLHGEGQALAMPPDDDEDADALELAQALPQYVPLGAYVVTDSPMLAFAADVPMPPELINLSSWRLKTGQLTAQQAIAWTEAYRSPAVIFWDDRLEELPDYVGWVQQRYRLARWFGKERRLYLLTGQPTQAAEAIFGQVVALEGASAIQASGEITLSLYWRAQSVPESDYTLRLEVRDGDGWRTVYQEALAPREIRPTRWHAGDLVVGVYPLDPAQLPVAASELAITLYAGEVALACQSQGQPVTTSPRYILPLGMAPSP